MTVSPIRSVFPPVKCDICGRDTIQAVRLVDGRLVCLGCWASRWDKNEVE